MHQRRYQQRSDQEGKKNMDYTVLFHGKGPGDDATDGIGYQVLETKNILA